MNQQIFPENLSSYCPLSWPKEVSNYLRKIAWLNENNDLKKCQCDPNE